MIPLLVGLTVALALSIAVADQEHDHDDDPAAESGLTDYVPDFRFILRTASVDRGFAFIGVGGEIDGQVNPTLVVTHDALVEITLINGDGIEHSINVAEFGATSGHVTNMWESTVLAFRTDEEGALNYTCTHSGHPEAGMIGLLVVAPHGQLRVERRHD